MEQISESDCRSEQHPQRNKCVTTLSCQEILGSLIIHDSWTSEESTYIKKRMGDLIRVSVLMENGCIRSNTSTKDNPSYRLSFQNLRGKTCMHLVNTILI
jgi:hypothetical protein